MQARENFTIVVLAAAALLLGAAGIAQAGIIAHWAFDETSGNQVAVDSTGTSHDGRLGSTTNPDANDPTPDIPGAIGTAFTFDGVNDYVAVSKTADLGGMTCLTLSAWFTLDTTDPATDRNIFRNWTSTYRAYEMGILTKYSPTRKVLKVGYSYSYEVYSDSLADLYNRGDLQLGPWQLLTFVFAGASSTKSATLYLNGKVIGTGSSFPSSINSSETNTLYLGSSGTANWWKGGLDDLGILNEALSLGKARALYTVVKKAGLAYNLSDMYKLFGVYETGTPVTIGPLTWYKVTGLTGSEGDAWVEGDFYYVQLDAAGNGVSTIPEPGTLALLAGSLLGLLCYAWRKRK